MRIIKLIFAFWAKIIYHKEYEVLKTRVLFEYNKLSIDEVLKKTLVQFLISGEDHRFRFHIGFDVVAILRAVKNYLFHGSIEGASTIEQQLVRVLIAEYELSLSRKIKEILLATTLTGIVPKGELPAIYLGVAHYGTELDGLEKILKKLRANNTELNLLCAEIVARIKYPEPIIVTDRYRIKISRRISHLLRLHQKHENSWVKIYG